jgi:HlyD family secretion protein
MESAYHRESSRDRLGETAASPETRTASVLAGRDRRRSHLAGAIWIIVALAIIGGVAAWWATRGAPPVSYTTAPVTQGPVSQTITASGSVNPMVTVQVGTYVSGVIQSISCDYNTQVKKGQTCAGIDPRPYQTIVDQDQATLATANAQLAKDQTNLDYTKLTFQRNQDLVKRGIVSQDTFDAAQSAYNQAQAQIQVDQADVQQRQAALDAAKVNLSYTNIVSPVDGTVISRNVNVGQTVAASFQTPTLFVIATDLTKMEVDANVSESDIGNVKAGDQASFTVEAFPDHPFTGNVTQVRRAPQTVQNVVTYDVVIDVANPDLLLRPGMTATTKIVVAQRDHAVRVPDQALRFSPGGLHGAAAGQSTHSQVWVLQNGEPVRRPVVVGLTTDAQAEILQGLQPGEQVIVGERGGNGAGGNASQASRLRLRL